EGSQARGSLHAVAGGGARVEEGGRGRRRARAAQRGQRGRGERSGDRAGGGRHAPPPPPAARRPARPPAPPPPRGGPAPAAPGGELGASVDWKVALAAPMRAPAAEIQVNTTAGGKRTPLCLSNKFPLANE